MGDFVRLRSWFTYDPADPGRVSPDHPGVARLVRRIAPGCGVTDLGGWVSLNLRLEPADLVLRVHQPFVSRGRMLAVQEVRRQLAAAGLTVPVAVPWQGSTVLRVGRHLAELEPWLPHERRRPGLTSYRWLFTVLGELHRAMSPLRPTVPRPVLASYAPPSTLRRWLSATRAATVADAGTSPIATELADLVRALARRWVPSTTLPRQPIHGDIHLSNVGIAPSGHPVYLDFGNMAIAPRVHDIAYALAHMVFALNDYRGADPHALPWRSLPGLIAAYEAAAGSRLTDMERRALAPYTAAVPVHYAARAGFFADPSAVLRSEAPFLELSRWLLARPDDLATAGAVTPRRRGRCEPSSTGSPDGPAWCPSSR